MGTKGGGDRVVGISHQLGSPLLTGQPCPGSMELSTHTAYVLCAPKASGTPTLPGWKQLQKLCQFHSPFAPYLGTGASCVDSDSSTTVQASLGNVLRCHLMALQCLQSQSGAK